MNRLLTDIALTADHLAHICLCTHSIAERCIKHLNHAMKYYDINTPARVAMFLSQMSYESHRFSYTEDNLGLSTKQLMLLYPVRFPTAASCEGYALNPKALAEYMYSGKFGNTKEGDAWLYRPRGFYKLIGKDCYQAAQDALGMAITGVGAERVADPEGAAWTSAWYWFAHKMNTYADNLDLKGVVLKLAEGPNTGAVYQIGRAHV